MKKHVHIYDAAGKSVVLHAEQKINQKSDVTSDAAEPACCNHDHADNHVEEHDHNASVDMGGWWHLFRPAIMGRFVLLISGIILDHYGPFLRSMG
ncbi:MAG: hypothetical protein IPI42_04875 [Saprospiraceae bacterium]|nr:hypothetical protein [Candidatus Parvibacillus calidus]